MLSKKIKVIFTGGTIGSTANDDNISTDESAKYLLLNKYQQKTGCDQSRFDTIQPISILSENAVVDDILKMAEYINTAQQEDVCGIILTHGSDTLAFSAPYLSLLLQNLKVPVVMVASNLILTDPNANGVDNFAGAVKLIDTLMHNQSLAQVPISQKANVYVSYKNPEDDFVSIHLGTRMNQPPAYSDSFYSPDGKRFAKIKDDKLVFENTNISKSNVHFEFNKNAKFAKKCLLIEPHTGLDYSVYDSLDFDYVVHGLYHSGTANTRKDYPNNNFINFAKQCQQNDKPLYLCNIKKRYVNYESTNIMKKLGVKFIYDTLPNVALAKINIAHNLLDEKDIQKYLDTNINGEIMQSPNHQNEKSM